MNRDFEFKQLMRAYRAGVISEQTFEKEMTELEHGNGNGDSGRSITVLGKTYGSEREAVIDVLDRFRAGEANGQKAFSAWEKQATTDCIRSGIRMITEREGYHARIFERRLADLGAECKAGTTDFSRKITEKLSDPKLSDNEKLLYLASLTNDPAAFFKPVLDFAENLKDDLESKELLKLYVQDELSSANWLLSACAALNPGVGANAPAGGITTAAAAV